MQENHSLLLNRNDVPNVLLKNNIYKLMIAQIDYFPKKNIYIYTY